MGVVARRQAAPILTASAGVLATTKLVSASFRPDSFARTTKCAISIARKTTSAQTRPWVNSTAIPPLYLRTALMEENAIQGVVQQLELALLSVSLVQAV